MNLISSFDTWPAGANGASSDEQVVAALLEDDHRPARRGQHVGRGGAGRPAADDHRVAVHVAHSRPGHLFVGVAARLDVAGELDRLPRLAVAVAAVLGRAVRAFARVLVQELA